jgi:ribose-phosphate pyrophosphokinase
MLKLYINGIQQEIKFRTFGAGEPHLYLDSNIFNENDNIDIILHYEKSEDIINMMLLNNIIENNYIKKSYREKSLICKYIPFGRQDRITDLGEPFSLKVFTDLVNSMGFTSVLTLDNHSDVTSALINRNIQQSQVTEFISTGMEDNLKGFDCICSPDVGAIKKIEKLISKLEDNYELIVGTKVRNLKTGEITETKIQGEVKGKSVMIVDDICDGGRTFIELAKVLYANGAKQVGLIVSHGIFSRGFEPLTEAGIYPILSLN